MSDTSNCGCCSGTAIDTPAAKFNRPGLPAIAYRAGKHHDFNETLLARLSALDFPALNALSTRDDSDYTIAVCDAFATLADVLTFYQERIANESYLRTATERRSVLELARLIGYELAPGVAASTAIAFTLEAAPGMPALAAQPVTVPVGTRVQSVPDADQEPQTFETVVPITGRVEWNAIPAQTTEPLVLLDGADELHLAGTNTQVQVGDAILLMDDLKVWDVCSVTVVDIDTWRNMTRLGLSPALGSKWPTDPATWQAIRAYVFRQRAALFGNNAPDARLIFTKNNPDDNSLTDSSTGKWAGFSIQSGQIDLDAAYPKITADSWLVLSAGGSAELFRATAVSQLSRSDFGISSKITRIIPDSSPDPIQFGLQETMILAQSEELALAQRPLIYPVYGATLDLSQSQTGLAPGQLIAISGKRQRVVVDMGIAEGDLSFPDDPARVAVPGESFIMHAPPEQPVGGSYQLLTPKELVPAQVSLGEWRWHLEDADGVVLKVQAPAGKLHLQPATKDDGVVSEVATIAPGGVSTDGAPTTLTLSDALQHCYDRSTVVVNANVAPATHGETVGEIAGSGDAARPNQSFQLKQSPLTYVSTPADPSGGASTLQVRVNDLLWHETPTLYGSGPLDRVYALRRDDDGKTTIELGDGAQGARLPSGQNNVRVSYRKGLGAVGNLRANQLTMLLTRPLGVKSATNPAPSSGGQDAETLADARKNAPLRVRTLGRAVSIADYVDFAATFSGIAKAHGIWIDDGRARGVHLTIAGAGGSAIPDGSDTSNNLVKALRRYGDRLLPLTVRSYAAMTFLLKAAVKIEQDADGDKVLAAVESALRSAYSFDAREFGQPVTIDDVYATIQAVPGVLAADVLVLCRKDKIEAKPQPWLVAALPSVQKDGTVTAAELITLDPAPLDLGVMA